MEPKQKPHGQFKRIKADYIYNTLTKQRFADWYEGKFFDHLEDGSPQGEGPQKKEILADIERLFLT